jgi:hypothetical protein
MTTSTARYLDPAGNLVTTRGFRFRNDGTTDQTAEVNYFEPRPDPARRQPKQKYTQATYLTLREDGVLVPAPYRKGEPIPRLCVRPGQEVVVPLDVARGFWRAFCLESTCPGRASQKCNPFEQPGHRFEMLGGLAPGLVYVPDPGCEVDVELHPLIVAPPLPQIDVQDMHHRVMARIAGGAQ